MTSASRGYAGEPDALHHPSLDAVRHAFAGSTSLAVADEDSSVDGALAEFDRRVALLNAASAGGLRFAIADFADGKAAGPHCPEPLSHVLQQAGPMPPDVAEECLRGTLDALHAAHARRWSHGDLTLDAFALDACGGVRLIDVGRPQKAAWLAAVDGLDRDGSPLSASEEPGRVWSEVFLHGAAEDLRRLATHVVEPLLQGIDGERPAWAERLSRRLDALDGTIGSLEDVDHAWRVFGAAFDEADAVEVFSAVEHRDDTPAVADSVAVNESSMDETPDDVSQAGPAFPVQVASPVVLFWVCIFGGLAAMAGTIAAVIVGR